MTLASEHGPWQIETLGGDLEQKTSKQDPAEKDLSMAPKPFLWVGFRLACSQIETTGMILSTIPVIRGRAIEPMVVCWFAIALVFSFPFLFPLAFGLVI